MTLCGYLVDLLSLVSRHCSSMQDAMIYGFWTAISALLDLDRRIKPFVCVCVCFRLHERCASVQCFAGSRGVQGDGLTL